MIDYLKLEEDQMQFPARGNAEKSITQDSKQLLINTYSKQ